MSEQKHVITLTPKQQFIMNLLLQNFFLKSLSRSMSYLSDNVGHPKIEELIQAKSKFMAKNFKQFNDFAEVLSTRSGIARGKTKMLTLNSEGVQVFDLAISNFESDQIYLDEQEVNQIKHEIGNLKKMVQDCATYVYTSEEIKKAKS